MQWKNSSAGYGALTKFFHWTMAAMILFQLVSATIMVRLGADGIALGAGQATYYNWHKSIGLVALVFAVGRVLARRAGSLPGWAPSLNDAERSFIHRAEQALYAAMFVMPISGFLYVMAGGYGVNLFGVRELPNLIGQYTWLATAAKWAHIGAGWVLTLALAGHIGLVLRHTLLLRDGLLRRMLPTKQR
jgi:cytochrome b561